MTMESTKDRPDWNHLLKFLKDIVWNYDTNKACLKVKYINKTGAASVKGTLVEFYSATAIDKAVKLTDVSSDHCIGVIAEDGIADGDEVFVIVAGSALVLLKDTTAATRGYWAQTSNVAGRADITNAAPVPATHWQEIGHGAESVAAGTDVLAEVNLHFL